jgi:uncharacterized membrane protein YedE/YeeE
MQSRLFADADEQSLPHFIYHPIVATSRISSISLHWLMILPMLLLFLLMFVLGVSVLAAAYTHVHTAAIYALHNSSRPALPYLPQIQRPSQTAQGISLSIVAFCLTSLVCG